MSGRVYVVILFFWAVLTIITPTLIRLSASTKPALGIQGRDLEGPTVVEMGLLSRKALQSASPRQPVNYLPPSPSPSPAKQPVIKPVRIASEDDLRKTWE